MGRVLAPRAGQAPRSLAAVWGPKPAPRLHPPTPLPIPPLSQVEEISAAESHKKAAAPAKKDPLDAFCDDNPDADECRVYED